MSVKLFFIYILEIKLQVIHVKMNTGVKQANKRGESTLFCRLPVVNTTDSEYSQPKSLTRGIQESISLHNKRSCDHG
jgi:hypothetical protein